MICVIRYCVLALNIELIDSNSVKKPISHKNAILVVTGINTFDTLTCPNVNWPLVIISNNAQQRLFERSDGIRGELFTGICYNGFVLGRCLQVLFEVRLERGSE